VGSRPERKDKEMTRTNQRNLVKVARAKGSAVASSWQAYGRPDGSVAIVHYTTHMVTVNPDNTVTPESLGWGSMTDKCGLRKILTDVSGQGYGEVFASF